MKRAVFLDRDGVINDAVVRDGKPFPPSSLADLKIPDEVKPALEQLVQNGYILVGVTNQPDVARGTQKKDVVEAINRYLQEQLPIKSILVCYHDNQDQCSCRKPKPGLILAAVEAWAIDLKNSFMIGDRWKDIEAGKQAGCKTIWLERHYTENNHNITADYYAETLTQAVTWILSLEK